MKPRKLWAFIDEVKSDTSGMSPRQKSVYWDLRIELSSSVNVGSRVFEHDELARCLLLPVDEAIKAVKRLANPEKPIVICHELPGQTLKIEWPRIIEAERSIERARANGARSKGNPKLRGLTKQDNQQVNQDVNQDVNQVAVVVEVGIPGEGGEGGEDHSGDATDGEILRYFRDSKSLNWSPRAHADVRFLLDKVGWPDTIRMLGVGIVAGKSDPPSYARGIHRNEEAREASKPKSTPEGDWAKKPYCPG